MHNEKRPGWGLEPKTPPRVEQSLTTMLQPHASVRKAICHCGR